jgi:hypothetical protein
MPTRSIPIGSMPLVVFAIVVGGCGDYCEYVETMCDGTEILRCIQSDGFADHSFADLGDRCEAGETCVDLVDDNGLRHAVCSFTGMLDPRCDPDARGITRVCADDTTRISCANGYASSEHVCEVVCVEPSNGAFCSLDAEPSPACTGSSGCDQVTGEPAVITCREGYEIDRIRCASDQTCIEAPTPFRRPYCASSIACEGSDSFCRGQDIEGCVAGRVVSMTCNEGTTCEEFGVLGPDNRPTGQTEAQCIRR